MTAHAHIKRSNLKTIYISNQRETIYKMDAKMKENFASRPGLKLLPC